MADTETAQAPDTEAASSVDVQEAELPEAGGDAASGTPAQIDILLDATLEVEVSLGRIQPRVRELLAFGPGSVVELDKRAGDPVDLYLRGKRFATGKLVVVGDQLGVRIKEILGPGSGS